MGRKLYLFVACVLVVGSVWAQRGNVEAESDTSYVAKRYVLVLLEKGPRAQDLPDAQTAARISESHQAYLDKLNLQGFLIVAGPIDEGGNYRSLLLFDLNSIDDALKLMKFDPAVKYGALKPRAMYWWGAQGMELP